MIRFTENREDIIKCWKEAFGDSDEDILYFVDNVKNAKCLAYYDDDKITSMLYLVKCSIGYYVYAACTLEEFREKGYMTELLNYVKAKYSPVCLIPAKPWLIDYYKKRGLNITIEISQLQFDEIDGIKEYLFEGCELENPIALLYKGE